VYATATRLAVLPFAGRLVELFGAPAMLRVAVAGIVLVPLPWALCQSLPALVAAEVLLLPVWLAKLVAILASFMVNFLISHFVVFRVRPQPKVDSGRDI